MAFTAWTASTTFANGDIVRATTEQNSGLVFKCQQAGTSDTTEPAWPTDIGSQISDGTTIWTAVSAVYEELAVIAPNAIVELFELQLDSTLHGSSDIYRWHNGVNADVTADITWNGNNYTRLPVQAEGFDYNSSGTLPRPTLTVSNVTGGITALLIEVNETTPGNDLTGAEVKRIRTLKKFLDGEADADPYATFPTEIWYVDRKASENRTAVQFELASKLDLAGIKLPKRQIVANICQWEYRGSECGYTSNRYFFNANDIPVSSLSEDVCGKRLSSCKKRHTDVFADGRAVDGSTTLTLDDLGKTIDTGDAVAGYGIASGTTVASFSGVTVTLSQAATATTTVDRTGTLQSNLTQIELLSSSQVNVGMTITGFGIPAGTIVTAKSGSTITISNPADFDTVATFKGSFSGIKADSTVDNRFWFTADITPDILVGFIVKSSDLPSNLLTTVIDIDTTEFLTFESFATFSRNVGASNSQFSFYSVAAQPAKSYSFAASTKYGFRKAITGLPFGSFPGAGLLQ